MRKVIYAGLVCSISIFATAVGVLFLPSANASANGAPYDIVLTYMSGLSNWGPTSASGVAEVIEREGEVDIDVTGLPSLSGETYTAWIIDTRDNESMNVGHFNTDDSKTAKIRTVLSAEIPDKGWNLFLLTVEPNSEIAKSPGTQKSIGGIFPIHDGTQTGLQQLPKTGGDTSQNTSLTTVQPSPSANTSTSASPTMLAKGNDGNILTYGVVILAVLGIGVFTRVKILR